MPVLDLLLLPWMLGPLAFVAGYVLGRLSGAFGKRQSGGEESPRERHYRAIEADLRVARRRLEEAEGRLAAAAAEKAELSAQIEALEAATDEQTATLELVRSQLDDECAKTRRLRDDLTIKAEETIRLEARARDAETELSLVNASSGSIDAEIARTAGR